MVPKLPKGSLSRRVTEALEDRVARQRTKTNRDAADWGIRRIFNRIRPGNGTKTPFRKSKNVQMLPVKRGSAESGKLCDFLLMRVRLSCNGRRESGSASGGRWNGNSRSPAGMTTRTTKTVGRRYGFPPFGAKIAPKMGHPLFLEQNLKGNGMDGGAKKWAREAEVNLNLISMSRYLIS